MTASPYCPNCGMTFGRCDCAPVAWSFELAYQWNAVTGEYCDWRREISVYPPCVPAGSYRNLLPLYAHAAEEPHFNGARKAALLTAARVLEDKARSFPVGHEDQTKGGSSYNWFKSCAAYLREISDEPRQIHKAAEDDDQHS